MFEFHDPSPTEAQKSFKSEWSFFNIFFTCFMKRSRFSIGPWTISAGAELHGGFSAAAQRLCEPKRQQPAPRRLCAGDSPQQARRAAGTMRISETWISWTKNTRNFWHPQKFPVTKRGLMGWWVELWDDVEKDIQEMNNEQTVDGWF